jgi:hypothetical protein
MQDPASQVNRPHGWGFHNITNGVIRNMSLYQVSVGMARPVLRSDLILVSLSP